MSFLSNLQGVGHQLMALRIDQQFLDIVKAQLVQAVEMFDGSLAEQVRAEVEALVELLYYMLSFAAKAATPGMLAVGLEASTDLNYPLLAAFVALKYSFNKMRHMSYTQEWSSLPTSTPERRMRSVLDYGSKGAAVLAVLNTVLFLAGGGYASILYRLIGFKMVINRLIKDQAGYKGSQLFVESKKILWTALLGVTAAAAVTIDWPAVRYFVYLHTRRLFAALYGSRMARQFRRAGAEPPTAVRIENVTVDSNRCTACQLSPPEMPHAIDCGHTFCYACAHNLFKELDATTATSSTSAAAGFGGASLGLTCPQCLCPVTKFAPINVD
ncbi:hypothetical protein B484DRAFT_435331 [Ochromonadaceae sp. CCMP2298]|nr:hypothetical protein B484DRAFT_435331 [Ochromonadaceae sp. CCMP2298]